MTDKGGILQISKSRQAKLALNKIKLNELLGMKLIATNITWLSEVEKLKHVMYIYFPYFVEFAI